MEIRKISCCEKNVIACVVDIHIKTFTGFFLTFMGKGFLKQMYTSYCMHEKSELIGAFEEDVPIGFCAYSANMSGLYKFMIKKKLIPFAWYSLGAFIRKPGVFMRLLRAFLKPSESERTEEYVELASIGVAPDIKNKGMGTNLIEYVKNHVDFSKISYIALETDAVDNDNVNAFYVKNGFKLERTYNTREGRKMNEYRYYRRCNQ